MTVPPTFDDVSPAIRAALEGRGFTALTPVQEAVLDPAIAGRDLRIFSQTGSGKTVAVGLAIAPALAIAAAAAPPTAVPGPFKAARPFALMVAPTRELATQIGSELAWLFEPLQVGVTAVTGGASYPRELAALRKGPLVIAGTPGRLIDHLGRKSIDPSQIGVVVLDEADQMLDMGFRDELDTILEQMPKERRTLLLSATFPREVQRLADRCQHDPVVAAAAGAGQRNADIAHVAHVVLAEERDRALLNLLLMEPGDRALVFVRTRESAAELADRLSDVGIPARAIHGDLEQRDRTRTLDAFRSGAVTTLVATDVAARGLDVPDVTRVIHADPPNDAEVFTHRSGRTGRAGKKGLSVILVPPGMRERVRAMLRRAGVEAAWSAAPSAADVLRAADDRLAAELLTPPEGAPAPEPRLQALAEKLLAAMDPRDLVTALLARGNHAGACAPADVTPILPQPPRTLRAPHTVPPPRGDGPGAERGPAPRARSHEGSGPSDRPAPIAFAPFRINWGERHGADPRRLLALVCRRGGIRGSEVGAIRIGPTFSSFQVAASVAEGFAQSVRKPDARDPKIRIEAVEDDGGAPRNRPYARREDGPPPRREDAPQPRREERPPPPRHEEGPPPAPRKPRPRVYEQGEARTHAPAVAVAAPEGSVTLAQARERLPAHAAAPDAGPSGKRSKHREERAAPATGGPDSGARPAGGHAPPKRRPRWAE